ncbi:hypothetical protein T484DRAFT_1944493 [Baffinella frigidus]|nr:hypothetical protein T484DRAFT_1944493 [Cryptophyta sp. CCMP2293]
MVASQTRRRAFSISSSHRMSSADAPAGISISLGSSALDSHCSPRARSAGDSTIAMSLESSWSKETLTGCLCSSNLDFRRVGSLSSFSRRRSSFSRTPWRDPHLM